MDLTVFLKFQIACISVVAICNASLIPGSFQMYSGTTEISGTLLAQYTTANAGSCVVECSKMTSAGCNVVRFNAGTGECELLLGFREASTTTWQPHQRGWTIFVHVHIILSCWFLFSKSHAWYCFLLICLFLKETGYLLKLFCAMKLLDIYVICYVH